MNRGTEPLRGPPTSATRHVGDRTDEPSAADVMRMPEFTLFAGVLCLVLAYLVYFTPELPQQIATHFDSAGHANGWSNRDTFVWLYGGMLVFMAMMFGGMATTVGKVPTSLWSFPNRDWWLTGARASATRRYLARWLLRFGSAMSLFMGVTLYQIVQANQAHTARLGDGFWFAFTLFMAYTLFESGRLIWRFTVGRRGSTP